jgi:hypothetical protein
MSRKVYYANFLVDVARLLKKQDMVASEVKSIFFFAEIHPQLSLNSFNTSTKLLQEVSILLEKEVLQ